MSLKGLASPADRPQRSAVDRDDLTRRYRQVRRRTEALAAPLSAEDMLVQSMPDASPTKWHLAHTTWFFEAFVLAPLRPGSPLARRALALPLQLVLRGRRVRGTRGRRGAALAAVARRGPRPSGRASTSGCSRCWRTRRRRRRSRALLLGTHHEEQHQELILTDIKHALAANPLRPAYDAPGPRRGREPSAPSRAPVAARLGRDDEGASRRVGHEGDGFAFDNEGPRHRRSWTPFPLGVAARDERRVRARSSRTAATSGRSSGSPTAGPRCTTEGWTRPALLGARRRTAGASSRSRDASRSTTSAPVAHVSYYEADAFARWAGRAAADGGRVGDRARAGRPRRGQLRRRAGAFAAAGAARRAAERRRRSSSATPGSGPRAPTCRIRGFAPARGRARRVQRQVHVRPDGAARRLVPHAAGHVRATYRNFFPPARALADDRHPPRARRRSDRSIQKSSGSATPRTSARRRRSSGRRRAAAAHDAAELVLGEPDLRGQSGTGVVRSGRAEFQLRVHGRVSLGSRLDAMPWP